MNNSRVIIPLDFSVAKQALDLVEQLNATACRLKVGKELFTRSGPKLVEQLIAAGFDVFLDLKYHDIPGTVAKACQAAADLGVWMVNVHASGGHAMLEAARNAVDQCSHQPLLIAVTMLTSLTDKDLQTLGINTSVEKQVLRLAALTQSCGLDGVVCSAKEAAPLQSQMGKEFCLVTPGIRPRATGQDDQKRVMSPAEAILAGSHYLVIGRPITKANNPVAALEAINAEVKQLFF